MSAIMELELTFCPVCGQGMERTAELGGNGPVLRIEEVCPAGCWAYVYEGGFEHWLIGGRRWTERWKDDAEGLEQGRLSREAWTAKLRGKLGREENENPERD